MARRRVKPNYNPELEKQILLDRLASEYGSYDDRIDGGDAARSGHKPTLGEVAQNNGMGIVKVRKLLVTAGVYSTRKSRWIKSMQDNGDSIEEIMKKTGLTRGSVYSYLPYKNVVYNLSERSPESDRSRLYQKRKAIVERIRHVADDMAQAEPASTGISGAQQNQGEEGTAYLLFDLVKEALYLFIGYYFETEEGCRFRIEVDDEGVRFGDEGEPLTWDGLACMVNNADPSTELDVYRKAVFKRIGLIS